MINYEVTIWLTNPNKFAVFLVNSIDIQVTFATIYDEEKFETGDLVDEGSWEVPKGVER